MGLNFHACCHRCKSRLYFYRGEESIPMHEFWRKHRHCIKIDKNACEIRGDGYGEQDWMYDYKEDGE